MRFVILIFCCLGCLEVQAQLGFCSGSKGDPIFHEDFDSGVYPAEPLPEDVTSYTYTQGRDPYDGEYTISDTPGITFGSWYSYLPETTVSNGNALIVNADFSAGRFYRTQVSGLCENTTYEFSAFLMNVHKSNTGVCPGGDIPINVRFEVWDETDTILLRAGNTGDIYSSSSAKWEQYALTFSSEPGQNSVILKMFNNGEGGCGNDLAIDDIIFRSCGDLTEVTSNKGDGMLYQVCEENAPASISLSASPDNSVYQQHFFQWQASDNGNTWQDLPGESSRNLQVSSINSSRFFRVKVAEDPNNLASTECSSASEAFQVSIMSTPAPPQSNGDREACSDEDIPVLGVSVQEGESVNWFDAQTGGNLLAENTETFLPPTSGTYYAEARKTDVDCSPSERTPVKLEIIPIPVVEDENQYLCPNSELILDAGLTDHNYLWTSGETSQTLVVDTPGTYEVEITNSGMCSSIKEFTVEAVPDPVISEIRSIGEAVNITTEFPGEFLYSIDGLNFQASSGFSQLPGGIYTAYVKDLANCKVDTREFVHLVVPKFISPNGDGYNDSFKMAGLEYFESTYIEIYDRYGKLLAAGDGKNFRWNGNLNGRKLPAGDYWYVIRIQGREPQKGSFSLIR